MKKVLSLILAVLMAASLAACGTAAEETKAPETTAAATTAATEAETTAALVNPMEEVKDSEEFVKKLGIQLNLSLLNSELKMFIIDGKIAEVRFDYDNIRENRVECTLRATKDEEAAKNLSGIYDSSLSEVSSFDLSGKNGPYTVTLTSNEAGDINIYTWKNGEVWYSFSLVGKTTGMELAEILYQVIAAIVGEAKAIAAEIDEIYWYELNADATELTVRLRANATTGYEWSYKIWDEQALKEVKAEYIPDEADGMTGVGGVWEAVFSVPAGLDTNGVIGRKNDITFTYARSWDKEKIPSKALDILIHDQTMEITGVHEPDLTTPMAEDGEYKVTLNHDNMLEGEMKAYALVGIPQVITFTEEEVKAVKAGDVIDLGKYGLDYNIEVDYVEKRDDGSIEINEAERFEFNKELNAWVIRDWDDDLCRYNKEMRQVYFTNETKIDDGMEDVYRTGNSGTVYDRMRTYRFVDATVTVKDGFVEKIRIYYHP